MHTTLEKYETLKKLMKKGNIKLLLILGSGKKRWSDFEEYASSRIVGLSLKDLINLGLVRVERHTQGLRDFKTYELTQKGWVVLKKLDEIAELLKDETKTNFSEHNKKD